LQDLVDVLGYALLVRGQVRLLGLDRVAVRQQFLQPGLEVLHSGQQAGVRIHRAEQPLPITKNLCVCSELGHFVFSFLKVWLRHPRWVASVRTFSVRGLRLSPSWHEYSDRSTFPSARLTRIGWPSAAARAGTNAPEARPPPPQG